MIGERNVRKIRIHPLVKVLTVGEEVGNSVRGSGNVFQRIIEILEEFYPPGLPSHNLLRFAEILEVLMVCEDSNRMLHS